MIKAVGRGSSSVTFALSYNSQIWREDSSVWLLGEDVGLGLGWKLQAGSIIPMWYGGSELYYLYTDSTGAQYILDQNNGSNVWSSISGIYVWYDANADVLHFPDGSFWKMNVVSASVEADAGTQYPSQMEDSNGNFITLTYGPAIGYPYNDTNTSSRITYIADARSAAYGYTYALSWPGSGLPHLSLIVNSVGTPENYTLSTSAQSLVDPFKSGSFGTATILGSLTVTGLGIGHTFEYDSSAELYEVYTPLGGVLYWQYATNAYATRSYREVNYRIVEAQANSNSEFIDSWTITRDSNQTWHTNATVQDVSANTTKQWTFSPNPHFIAGLATEYQEIGTSSSVLLQKSFLWSQSSSLNPYVGTLTSTLNPGQSYAASTTTTQAVDAYGNLTQQQVTDYSGSPTGTRTYNMTYTASNANYTPYYIFNRLLTATVTPSSGSPYTLSSTVYDATSCGYTYGLIATSATSNHDANYGTSLIYRGNPTSVAGLSGLDSVCSAYDTAGVPYYSADASGHSVSLSTSPSTNYSLPSSVSPNGNGGMATTATYASSWAPAILTGPNGDSGTTTYDSYGRPYQTTIPDGAVTTYTYTYATGASTQTATVDGRWQTTTLDGFGRTIQMQKGNGSTVVSTVQTQYAPCACSPLGKVSAVSQPYAPNATIYWTRYTYDGSGRTLTVTAPDGASTTQYSYHGNSTTVTDPAGKWKTSTVDAYGNLAVVTEPNPAGGTFTTNYAYTPANQLTGVSMTRGNVTLTRTLVYNGSDLTNATNPENGTVTYVYDYSHHLTSRTDALGSKTVYTYDSYGRLSEVQYYPGFGYYDGIEDPNQRVTYYYDGNFPNAYPCAGLSAPSNQYSTGRLSAVVFVGGIADAYKDSYCYQYGYTQSGRVATQQMMVAGNDNTVNFTASYQWDDEGRMTSLQYPTVSTPRLGTVNMPIAGLQYDVNGRLTAMTMNDQNGQGPQPFASASYYPTGQLYTLQVEGWTETRTYNSLMQLITQSVPGALSMTYNYSATQNNGRITGSVDGITGENTSYSYDALNRLTNASNSLWGEAYTYDGFGNLTSKTGSGGSPNPAPTASMTYNSKNQLANLYYDANGNQNAYDSPYGGNTYSVENRLTLEVLQNSSPYPANIYAYEPWGKRVMSGNNPNYSSPQPTYNYTFYGITGQKLAMVTCNGSNYPAYPTCAIVGQNVYFGKKLITAGGVNVLTDRLG